MYQKRFALGLLAAVAGVATAASDVTQLADKDFRDYITTNKDKLVLAKFYAPWCGHCKALAPEFDEAATSLKANDIKLVKIDCTESAELCQEQGIEGYPTLKIFRGLDNVSPYNGQRKADAIHSYMVKRSLPAVSLLTKDTLEDFKTSDKVVVIAYIAADDKASNETFTSIANGLRDEYLFGGVNDAAVAEAQGVKVPAIVLYKTFDEGKAPFSGRFETEEIKKFIQSTATPLVGEVGPETYSSYMSAGIPLAYIFAETAEERESLGKEFKPVARKHKGKVNFATIDAKQFGAHAANLNLESDKFPCFAIQDTVNNKKFPFNQEKKLTHDNIDKFLDDFVAGKIEPSVKSEPVPEKQDGPVTIVVTRNYDEIVLDDAKDVLIEFYAPWCGHCKALAPKYDQLGNMYAKSEFKDKVVIAKVDATANDVPDDVSGFPTIKLYPAGDKKNPVTYSGSRTVEDLVKFIEESGKYKANVSIKEEGTEEAAPAATETAAKEKEAKEKADKAEGGSRRAVRHGEL